MVHYLKEVLGIKYIQIDRDELSALDHSTQEDLEGLNIQSGDLIWLGEGLLELPVFNKMVQAHWEYLSKKGFSGNIIFLDVSCSDILNADFEWPEGVTFICYDHEFYKVFQQVLPDKARIILIPNPAHFDRQPELKKIAWQTLIKEI